MGDNWPADKVERVGVMKKATKEQARDERELNKVILGAMRRYERNRRRATAHATAQGYKRQFGVEDRRLAYLRAVVTSESKLFQTEHGYIPDFCWPSIGIDGTGISPSGRSCG